MPRDGAIILSDLIGKLDVLRVTCAKCGHAGLYRQQAHQLAETAAREPREDRRRYMLELVATYEPAAYQLVPSPLPSPSAQIFCDGK